MKHKKITCACMALSLILVEGTFPIQANDEKNQTLKTHSIESAPIFEADIFPSISVQEMKSGIALKETEEQPQNFYKEDSAVNVESLIVKTNISETEEGTQTSPPVKEDITTAQDAANEKLQELLKKSQDLIDQLDILEKSKEESEDKQIDETSAADLAVSKEQLQTEKQQILDKLSSLKEEEDSLIFQIENQPASDAPVLNQIEQNTIPLGTESLSDEENVSDDNNLVQTAPDYDASLMADLVMEAAMNDVNTYEDSALMLNESLQENKNQQQELENELIELDDMSASLDQEIQDAKSGAMGATEDKENTEINIHNLNIELSKLEAEIAALKGQNSADDAAGTLKERLVKVQNDLKSIETIEIFRVYNPNSGEHFYTADKKEVEHLSSVGWKDEGKAWDSPKNDNTKPVYRLYNPNQGDHHYTDDEKEKDYLASIGWRYEGISWNSDPNEGVRVFRVYNPNAKHGGAHHFTTDEIERDHLVRLGWRSEEVGFYSRLMYSIVKEQSDDKEGIVWYDQNDKKLTGSQKIFGYWYYFNPSTGFQTTGMTKLPENGQYRYFGDDGRNLYGHQELVDPNDGKIYAYCFSFDDGYRMHGFNDLDIDYDEYAYSTLYLKENGQKYYGLLKIDDCIYMLDEKTGKLHEFYEVERNGKYYVYGRNGKMLTGFVNFSSSYTNSIPKTFYYEEDGSLFTGTSKWINGVNYLFNSDHALYSYDYFKSQVLGKGFDIDHAYGNQCWDGYARYCQYLQAGFAHCWQTGYVKDIWNMRKTNGILKYFDEVPLSQIKKGDLVVYNSCKTTPLSHICIFEGYTDGTHKYGWFLGQNQGGPKGAFNMKDIAMAGIFPTVFRPKTFWPINC